MWYFSNVSFLEITKNELKVGHIVAVYAQSDNLERFWLLRIREIHKKKMQRVWFNKIEHQTYTTGASCVVFDNVQFFSRLSGCFYFINKVLFKRARKLWSLINLLTFYSSFFILIFSRRHRIINMRKHF